MQFVANNVPDQEGKDVVRIEYKTAPMYDGTHDVVEFRWKNELPMLPKFNYNDDTIVMA